jgi:hypothetical protein
LGGDLEAGLGGLDAEEIVTLYATEAILATEFESRPG